MSKTTLALRLVAILAASSVLFLVALVGGLAPLAACDQFPSDQVDGSSSTLGEGGSSTTTSAGLQSVDATTLCARLIDQCGQSLAPQSCQQNFQALRVTPACNTALASAPCSDLTNSSSTTMASCFPPCSGTLAQCNADGTLTVCTTEGTTEVHDCQSACVAQGYTRWTGVCDTTYMGQASDRPQCWCQ
jgi:hypothetical protein